MAKLTLEQKRLETLRRQLYGKNEHRSASNEPKKTSVKYSDSTKETAQSQNSYPLEKNQTTTYSHSQVQDTAFLKTDLMKIIILTFLAIGAQLILYFALQNNLLPRIF